MRLPRRAAGLIAAVALLAPMSDAVHREATVVDLHSDTILEVASGKRDITARSTSGHIDLPRLREGGVDVQVFALFVDPRFAGQGYARVTALLDAFDRLDAQQGALVRATSVAEIEEAVRAGRIAVVLAVENGTAIDGNLEHLGHLHARGVRMMSLTWNNSNDLADGASEEVVGGLTPLGRRVLARMQELRLVIDVSHLSERSFWDVLAATTGPLVATHSNAAGLTPHRRNLSDDQLRAIVRRGGIVGVNFYPTFTGGATLAHVLDHIDYLVRIMGADYVALGSDFDGFSQTVKDLEDVSHLPNLTAGLIARGYRPADVRKVLGGNAMRVFRQVWGR